MLELESTLELLQGSKLLEEGPERFSDRRGLGPGPVKVDNLGCKDIKLGGPDLEAVGVDGENFLLSPVPVVSNQPPADGLLGAFANIWSSSGNPCVFLRC